MLPDLHLADSGTLDTLLECGDCGAELYYTEADRRTDDTVKNSWIKEKAEEHMEECSAMEEYDQEGRYDDGDGKMFPSPHCHGPTAY